MRIYLLLGTLLYFILESFCFAPVFFIEGNGWKNQTHAGYIGHFKLPVTEEFPSWWIGLIHPQPIVNFEAWQGTFFHQSADKKIVYIKQTQWNGHQYVGQVMDQRYLIDFVMEPNVDYSNYYGPRPTIVFRDKVYKPSPYDNHEHEMKVYNVAEYNLPANFEMFPVFTVTTTTSPLEATKAPRVKPPGSGFFWFVQTRSPPLSAPTIATQTSTTTTVTGTTTRKAFFTSCSRIRQRQIEKCENNKKKKSLKQCNIAQCSKDNPTRYNVLQCWKYRGSCWCVDSRTGVRSSKFVKYKHSSRLRCSTGELVTKPVKAATTSSTPLTAVFEGGSPPPVPIFTPRNSYNYNQVIHNSLLFYEAQRSGAAGNGRIYWKTNSHMRDGQQCGRVDLQGGYYVSGDYVKYGFPTASAMTVLAWGFLEFPDAYKSAWETEFLKRALKWGADYFIKAHVSKYMLVGMVGNPENENKFWLRPDEMSEPRPCFNITSKNPGSDLAAETAAALAATAKVYIATNTNKDDPYVLELLRHAKELFEFATRYRGIYSNSIREAKTYYESFNYYDELAWAALWLYDATGEQRYLAEAGRLYEDHNLNEAQGEFSWETKTVGVQLLLSKFAQRNGAINPALDYLEPVAAFCDSNLPGGGTEYTPQGLLFTSEWGTNRYACNAAFICLVASTLPQTNNDQKLRWRQFAENQMDYMLGRTGKSFVVGYGEKFPRRPHHRMSSCPTSGECGWDVYHKDFSNPQILYGALVGGPDKLDQWTDDRTNFKSNGVGLDYNAGMQGAAAGLKHFQIEYGNWLKYRARTAG